MSPNGTARRTAPAYRYAPLVGVLSALLRPPTAALRAGPEKAVPAQKLSPEALRRPPKTSVAALAGLLEVRISGAEVHTRKRPAGVGAGSKA